jgi:hypothetical protein
VTYLVDEEEKVAIARIKVGLYVLMEKSGQDKWVKRTFNAERADLIKVVGVYVCIHAKQSSHNGAHSVFECPREWHAYASISGGRKQGKQEEIPMVFGKTASSSRILWVQFIRASTYSGAGSFVGRL